jgi:hypothetical protein
VSFLQRKKKEHTFFLDQNFCSRKIMKGFAATIVQGGGYSFEVISADPASAEGPVRDVVVAVVGHKCYRFAPVTNYHYRGVADYDYVAEKLLMDPSAFNIEAKIALALHVNRFFLSTPTTCTSSPSKRTRTTDGVADNNNIADNDDDEW